MKQEDLFELNFLLCEWFEKNGRTFPWRKTNNLYKILISEILLRKTNAEMVSNFFGKFLEKYPNFQEIRKISEQELETDLIPLGLYKTRVKTLKTISIQIQDENSGKIPESSEELHSFYGIGRYIANAVLCFGLNKDVVLLDTNINRILSRIFNKTYPKKITPNHPLWKEIQNTAKFKDKKTFFMALIDFGALICKERGYHCGLCPLEEFCMYTHKFFFMK